MLSASRPLSPTAQARSSDRGSIDRLNRRMFEISLAQDRCYDFDPKSDLVDRRFCEYFASKLIEAHVINRYRVEGRQFETLMAGAVSRSGLEAELADSLTNAGHDLVIGGARFQLKTEGSKKIHADFIHISKLMESAGTKKVRRREDAVAFLSRVRVHLDQYERILVLRIFDQEDNGRRGVRYDLVEIPKTLFNGLEALQPTDFTLPRPSGHTSAPVAVPGDPVPAMTIVFDGSDNKIQLRRVRADLCRTHASFWVPWGEDILRASGLPA